ncbi:MAG: DUF488 domain-containing protein [Planctomycetaceae bacterium]
MLKKLRLATFQIGSLARRGEGLRIGAARFPPRGVPKARWVADGYFDVWFPNLAPSRRLLAWARKQDLTDRATCQSFFDRYERELLATIEGRQAVALVAEIARRTLVSVGCYCDDETRCHRSRLHEIIARQAGST